MATVAESLFGVTPESLMADREQRMQEQALRVAQLDPFQQARYTSSLAANRLGSAIGGLLGAEDPELMRVRQRQQLLQGINPADPASLRSAAQKAMEANDFQAAQMLADRALAAETEQAKLGQAQAKYAKEVQSMNMEEKLRKELSQLSADATEEDILKVVTKYGSPDKVLSALQTSQNKRAEREQKAELQKEKLEAQAQRDRERAQERQDLAILVNSLKQSQTQSKPLTSGDIREINKIKSNVDTANNTIEQADSFINLIDEGKMQFGAGENALGVVRRLAGKSNESDLNKVEFEQFVTSSVNSILNLAKGPQTDQDAKRAEKQIIDALNKNDSKAVKRGLESLKKVWEGAKATDMSALELYSSERGGKQLAPATEVKTPTAPKATKRFNPATGKIEPL